MTDYLRLTINVAPPTAAEIRRRAMDSGITLTEWLRRAVALQIFVEDNSPNTDQPETDT